jgi:ferritin-like metal-binding protein YciE
VIEELRPTVVAQLQALHALKAGALKMFDPMLAAVAKARDGDAKMSEVSDLLGRMQTAFGGHREVTAEHAAALEDRLRALGAKPSGPKVGVMGLGAMGRAHLGAIGGQNFGANARDAFVFEHLEIALASLLEQLADRAGDTESADLARRLKADDQGQAAIIDRNWVNVTSLMLASRGLPVHRPPEG